jgi:hypothetical protein
VAMTTENFACVRPARTVWRARTVSRSRTCKIPLRKRAVFRRRHVKSVCDERIPRLGARGPRE